MARAQQIIIMTNSDLISDLNKLINEKIKYNLDMIEWCKKQPYQDKLYWGRCGRPSKLFARGSSVFQEYEKSKEKWKAEVQKHINNIDELKKKKLEAELILKSI
jgi:hypothetical protein